MRSRQKHISLPHSQAGISSGAVAAVVIAFILFSVCHRNRLFGSQLPSFPDRGESQRYNWNLPPGFPVPRVPPDNPMSAAKAELGRYLFYDKRLSFNQKQACADCHQQSRAFTDGRPRAIGSTGELHPRSAMTLVNVAYVPALGWANPELTQLEAQALVPMFGDRPVELGMQGREELLLTRLKQVPRYQRLFSAAYPDMKEPFTITSVVQ